MGERVSRVEGAVQNLSDDMKDTREDIGHLRGSFDSLGNKFASKEAFVEFKKGTEDQIEKLKNSRQFKYVLTLIGLIISLIANILVVYERFNR